MQWHYTIFLKVLFFLNAEREADEAREAEVSAHRRHNSVGM